MEKLMDYAHRYHPFNSELETGIRAVVLLDAFYPRQCELVELTWFDHLVIHTADFDAENAPDSLHPDLPNRTGELLVRRQLVDKSLRMMQRVHLVDVIDTDKGIFYSASEDAPTYISLLQSNYSCALKERAQWMATRFNNLATADIKTIVEARVGRWTAEFNSDSSASGNAI